jgi:uncharacterized protein YggE
MKRSVVIFIFFISRIVSFGQLENIPLVTVFGEASVKVKPDYAVIGIKIRKQLPSGSVESSTALEIFKSEDTKIRLFGFDAKNSSETVIQMDSTMYVKEVFITVNDLNLLDKYLLELNKLGFKDFIYLDYRVRELLTYKNQARREAINAAKKKATILAAEVGQTIGKVHRIEEEKSEDFNWFNIHNTKGLENIPAKLGADSYAIEPGFIVFTARIKVSFDLMK